MAALPPVGATHARSIRPLLNALFAGTFVAVKPVGAFGPIKLSCAAALLPIFFDILFSYFPNYALRSPANNHVVAATLVAVTDELVVLNVAPGVARIVIPDPVMFAPVPAD